ncbi:MAG: tetratricopeptide repeat protein [Muribaculaceae bacterium]|nr:tetratricopeptide repeat protein [Muribaculaceae bacterium]MDE6754963.1 tetratricopeptide repeat protein [Muribaculaceae bacterium]
MAIIITSSCDHQNHDKRLVNIATSINDSIGYADSSLKEIDKKQLSKADQHYYDFLSLKIADKKYIIHESDSLYLTILNYYDRHKKEDFYPEILYYGGRVYSDLGDYPTALTYFHNALDALGENRDKNPKLYSRIASQTGRLLNQVRLYSEAEVYVNKAIETNRKTGDLKNLMFNLQLLGSINMNILNLTSAKKYYVEAYQISLQFYPHYVNRAKMYLAEVEKELGNYQNALGLIRGIPENVKPLLQNQAYAYAADIYHCAGVLDTAFTYSKKIINSSNISNRKNAFRILLSEDMMKYIPGDSLSWYFQQYHKSILDYMDKNNNSQIELQQSAYNYTLALKEKEKTEKIKNKAIVWASIATSMLAILFLIIYGILNQKKIKKLKLQQAFDKIRYLQICLEKERLKNESNMLSHNTKNIDSTCVDMPVEKDNNKSACPPGTPELRGKLRNELREMANQIKDIQTSSHILNSEVYSLLQNYIKTEKTIPNNSEIWDHLENIILKTSPDFKKNLSVLMNGKDTLIDIETSMLIKCGFTPSSIAILLGKTPATIGSRRDSISIKIFGEKIGTKLIDNIIRLL